MRYSPLFSLRSFSSSRPLVVASLVFVIAGLIASCASTTGSHSPQTAPLPPAQSTPPATAPAAGIPQIEAPSLGWFSNIRVPSGHVPTLRLNGKGVQIFRCEQRQGAYNWVFRLPEAELFDAKGAAVGRHGANFTFELADGSRVLGTIVASEDLRDEKNLRWLLLSARPFGSGDLSGVSYVQRINTTGGMPPARCSAGQQNQLLRVSFSAEFVFYKPQP